VPRPLQKRKLTEPQDTPHPDTNVPAAGIQLRICAVPVTFTGVTKDFVPRNSPDGQAVTHYMVRESEYLTSTLSIYEDVSYTERPLELGHGLVKWIPKEEFEAALTEETPGASGKRLKPESKLIETKMRDRSDCEPAGYDPMYSWRKNPEDRTERSTLIQPTRKEQQRSIAWRDAYLSARPAVQITTGAGPGQKQVEARIVGIHEAIFRGDETLVVVASAQSDKDLERYAGTQLYRDRHGVHVYGLKCHAKDRFGDTSITAGWRLSQTQGEEVHIVPLKPTNLGPYLRIGMDNEDIEYSLGDEGLDGVAASAQGRYRFVEDQFVRVYHRTLDDKALQADDRRFAAVVELLEVHSEGIPPAFRSLQPHLDVDTGATVYPYPLGMARAPRAELQPGLMRAKSLRPGDEIVARELGGGSFIVKQVVIDSGDVYVGIADPSKGLRTHTPLPRGVRPPPGASEHLYWLHRSSIEFQDVIYPRNSIGLSEVDLVSPEGERIPAVHLGHTCRGLADLADPHVFSSDVALRTSRPVPWLQNFRSDGRRRGKDKRVAGLHRALHGNSPEPIRSAHHFYLVPRVLAGMRAPLRETGPRAPDVEDRLSPLLEHSLFSDTFLTRDHQGVPEQRRLMPGDDILVDQQRARLVAAVFPSAFDHPMPRADRWDCTLSRQLGRLKTLNWIPGKFVGLGIVAETDAPNAWLAALDKHVRGHTVVDLSTGSHPSLSGKYRYLIPCHLADVRLPNETATSVARQSGPCVITPSESLIASRSAGLDEVQRNLEIRRNALDRQKRVSDQRLREKFEALMSERHRIEADRKRIPPIQPVPDDSHAMQPAQESRSLMQELDQRARSNHDELKDYHELFIAVRELFKEKKRKLNNDVRNYEEDRSRLDALRRE
jgi:hypothetical protein